MANGSNSITVNVSAGTGNVERALRVIAKHATACADELAALRAEDSATAEGSGELTRALGDLEQHPYGR